MYVTLKTEPTSCPPPEQGAKTAHVLTYGIICECDTTQTIYVNNPCASLLLHTIYFLLILIKPEIIQAYVFRAIGSWSRPPPTHPPYKPVANINISVIKNDHYIGVQQNRRCRLEKRIFFTPPTTHRALGGRWPHREPYVPVDEAQRWPLPDGTYLIYSGKRDDASHIYGVLFTVDYTRP
jgi:hypothetical protein